jgi:hypothetical protein
MKSIRVATLLTIFVLVAIFGNDGRPVWSLGTERGPSATVLRDGEKVVIVDLTGEKWDVTEAAARGFDPKRFRHGIGRFAFAPLDNRDISKDHGGVPPGHRVIGVTRGTESHAYAVPKLAWHEIANTTISNDPVAAAY